MAKMRGGFPFESTFLDLFFWIFMLMVIGGIVVLSLHLTGKLQGKPRETSSASATLLPDLPGPSPFGPTPGPEPHPVPPHPTPHPPSPHPPSPHPPSPHPPTPQNYNATLSMRSARYDEQQGQVEIKYSVVGGKPPQDAYVSFKIYANGKPVTTDEVREPLWNIRLDGSTQTAEADMFSVANLIKGAKLTAIGQVFGPNPGTQKTINVTI